MDHPPTPGPLHPHLQINIIGYVTSGENRDVELFTSDLDFLYGAVKEMSQIVLCTNAMTTSFWDQFHLMI